MFIFWRISRFEFLFIQDKRAIVCLLLCLLFVSIVSVEWPVVGRPAWCHIHGEKKVSTLSPNPASKRVFHQTLNAQNSMITKEIHDQGIQLAANN